MSKIHLVTGPKFKSRHYIIFMCNISNYLRAWIATSDAILRCCYRSHYTPSICMHKGVVLFAVGLERGTTRPRAVKHGNGPGITLSPTTRVHKGEGPSALMKQAVKSESIMLCRLPPRHSRLQEPWLTPAIRVGPIRILVLFAVGWAVIAIMQAILLLAYRNLHFLRRLSSADPQWGSAHS